DRSRYFRHGIFLTDNILAQMRFELLKETRLTRQEVGKIFDLLISELQERLVRQGIGLVVSPVAKRHLIDKGYSKTFGARPLRRAIEDELEHAIAEGIISGIYQKGAILEARVEKGNLTLEQRTE
ncbi:MAG: hypothetical protein WAQ26_01655, partial [Candidatus Saccharimonas aalborgensis]